MTIPIIQPSLGKTVREWTDQMALDLWRFGAVPRLDHDDEWREWGANLNNVLNAANIAILPPGSIRSTILPDPYQFTDWRRWAERVVENLASTSL